MTHSDMVQVLMGRYRNVNLIEVNRLVSLMRDNWLAWMKQDGVSFTKLLDSLEEGWSYF